MYLPVLKVHVHVLSNSRNLWPKQLQINSEIFRHRAVLPDNRMIPSNEPHREKTGLRDFRPGPTQTGLYKLRSRLEA